ncbi:hypothetical protein ACVGW6_00945 [Enterobacter intestinihominis]
MNTQWKATDDSNELFAGSDRASGEVKYTATRLFYYSHSCKNRCPYWSATSSAA